MLSIYNPNDELLSKPELEFEVENEPASFNMPVVIRVEHRSTGSVFFQRQNDDKKYGVGIVGSLELDKADKFNSLKEANDRLDWCRRWYNDSWSFEIWSIHSFNKGK